MVFNFKELMHVLDFIRPLLVNNYQVDIYPIYKPFPFDNSLDHFEVHVSDNSSKIIGDCHD